MNNIKIILIALSTVFLLIMAACGSTAVPVDSSSDTVTVGPDASMFTSVYSGLSDDETTAVWLGVAADGSDAVLCVFDTVSGKSKKWYGRFFDDGASVIITDRRTGTDVTFGYKTGDNDSYLIDLHKYGEILINKTEPSCLAAVIEEAK